MSTHVRYLLVYAPTLLAAAIGLVVVRYHDRLLFHTLAELFSVTIVFGIFMMAWSVRRFQVNNYLMFLGISSLFVGVLALLHTLAYKGMNVFPGFDGNANLPTQLWIAMQTLFAGSLIAAPLVLETKLRVGRILTLYAGITASLIWLIFAEHFPDCFVAPTGLTPFKVRMEWVIVAGLVTAMALLWWRRSYFDRKVLITLVRAMGITIGSELCFMLYTDPHGTWNAVGHLLKIFSYYLIYKAVIATGLARPYDVLFRDLRQSEEALRQSEQRYRSLAERSREPILVLHGKAILYVNAAAAKLMGTAQPQDLLGRDLLAHVCTQNCSAVAGTLDRLETGEIQAHLAEFRLQRLDLARVSVEGVATRITYRGEPATQLLLEDITQRKQAEREMKEARDSAEAANQAKDEFLAVLSHELRNPLNPVLVAVSALEQQNLPKQVLRDLEMIRRNVELEARLIDDLLDLTRIAKGKIELSLTNCDLRMLLQHSLEICSQDVQSRQLRLCIDFSAERYHLNADPARIQQVLWNVLKNAVKFTPAGGSWCAVSIRRRTRSSSASKSPTAESGSTPMPCRTSSTRSSKAPAASRGSSAGWDSGWRSAARWWNCTAVASARPATAPIAARLSGSCCHSRRPRPRQNGRGRACARLRRLQESGGGFPFCWSKTIKTRCGSWRGS